MNKRDVVDAVAAATDMTRAQAAGVVEATFAALADGLCHSQKISVSGFGSFAPEQRRARRALHPRTKQPLQIPALRTVKFKPASALIARMNEADGWGV
jgi:DNA-binding protein HU-beta